MSYSLPKLLTLPLVAVFAATLFAQDADFRQAMRQLAAPTAAERAIAVAAIANNKADIAAAARVAFKDARVGERCGLLEAFEARADNGLLVPAVNLLAQPGIDERVSESARAYVLSLPEAKLTLDESTLNPEARVTWQDLRVVWLRIQITDSLVDALLKPGKFHGQFAALRRRDGKALDAELVRLVELDTAYLEALEEGSARRHARGVDADRMFTNPWRRLTIALGNYEPALALLRGEGPDELPSAERDTLIAAAEMIGDLRTAAVRALAGSETATDLVAPMRQWHLALQIAEPAPALRNYVNTEGLRTEIELTLARFGDRELLDARLAGLRAQVERFNQGSVNINARIANRPDIAARNEAAHLLLRSGDHAGAETEWLSLVKEGHEIERLTKDSQRSAVASFLGSVYYNLACAQALQLKLTRAGQSLETAVANGYRDYAWMLEDGDLEPLRRTVVFRTWFGRLAPPALVDRLPALD